MPNFNAVAHLVRPAERPQTYMYFNEKIKSFGFRSLFSRTLS